MGCCVSTGNTKTAATKSHLNKNSTSNRASPPTNPLLEEETVVKEVLSETPSLPKPTISRFTENDQPTKKAMPFSPNNAAALLPKLQDEKQHHNHHHKNDGVFEKPRMVFSPPDEFSEDASEICSSTLSESVSTATEKIEYNGGGGGAGYHHDDVSKIRPRSPSNYRNKQFSGDRSARKSPARRSEQSPGRVGPGRGGSANNGLVGNGRSSDRRSRSPVTRVDGSGSRTALGRCPSARGLGKSPGRVRSELSGRIRRGDDCGNSCSRENKLAPTSSNESLENPLVSLECFIFL